MGPLSRLVDFLREFNFVIGSYRFRTDVFLGFLLISVLLLGALVYGFITFGVPLSLDDAPAQDDIDFTILTPDESTPVVGAYFGDSSPEAELESNSPTFEQSAGEVVKLDASESKIPDDEDITYEFDVTGDGDTEYDNHQSAVFHRYDNNGEYEATVTITDEDGNTDTATTTVRVSRD